MTPMDTTHLALWLVGATGGVLLVAFAGWTLYDWLIAQKAAHHD